MTAVDGRRFGIKRKAWSLPFMAEPRELAGLRRIMRLHLNMWGLPHVVESAQLCVTELVTNVITHVGPQTPTTLGGSMRGGSLRMEVTDPDVRALPTLVAAMSDDTAGRGMGLVDATAERWGVILREDAKVTRCELATGLRSADGHLETPQVERAESLLALYCLGAERTTVGEPSASVATMREVASGVITDDLHWLGAHRHDPYKVLDSLVGDVGD
ncbi:ATP-binding protein [Streptomyces sp. NPDC002221]|uniref:ATP-binding protein n=1 Tax=Streptomyces sp. NPDC002221 TaxID=3364639 RepID=UPI0036AD7099